MVGGRCTADDGVMADRLPPPPPPGKPVRLRTAPHAVAAAFCLTVSTPFVVWWAFGNQDERVPGLDPVHDPRAFSRTFDPPAISAVTELMIGLVATVVFVTAALTLVSATRFGRLDQRWWPPIVGCAGLGAIAGVAERTLTAATIGANIDAGILVLLGAPTVAFLAIGFAIWTVQLFRSTLTEPRG